MGTKKHLFFDFDGVIADTFEFHLNNLNDIFKIDLTAEEYRQSHDGNFYDGSVEKLKDLDYQLYLQKVWEKESNLLLLPEAKTILMKFSDNYFLHLVTSGWRQQVLPFLQNNEIDKLFHTLYFADDGTSKRDKLQRVIKENNTQPEDCVFVTDTLGDIREAHDVNVKVAAVTFGFHDEDRLKTGSPEYIVHSWSELNDIVPKIF